MKSDLSMEHGAVKTVKSDLSVNYQISDLSFIFSLFSVYPLSFIVYQKNQWNESFHLVYISPWRGVEVKRYSRKSAEMIMNEARNYP